ncbi:cell wall hydrolase [Ferruginivarius sediminum]|uniref:Cell wall hydrolase SleB domain-containing protein n=1 Tax=Ferruginivarius sediminum TaxID=2661937 RepID=A0A369T7P2_9PROT|nr:cell wall hydrolase [Ferruginivarius sediminum]RDD60197.1 hypothetical protein DRB17_19290 [Ferruginivarius sediminum]
MKAARAARSLVAMYRTPPVPEADPAELDAAWIAHRLFASHADEPVRTLEALAVAEANRLRRQAGRERLYPKLPAPPDDDARYRACLRTARRALAGALPGYIGGATHYHRRNVEPRWAAQMTPAAEVGDFIFYERED